MDVKRIKYEFVTLSNAGKTRIIISKIRRGSVRFAVVSQPLPFTLLPGHSRRLKISFQPLATGSVSGNVLFVSDAANSPLELRVHGTGVTGSLVSVPSRMIFGDVALQKTRAEYETLRNLSSTSVTISSVTASGADFSTQGLDLPLTLRVGESYTFKSVFRPKSTGTKTASLTVRSNAADSTLKIALTGSCTTAQHRVTLKWDASASGVAGYNVYRTESSGRDYSRLNANPDAKTSFTDGSVESGKTYYYVTTAVSEEGVESAFSSQVKAAIP